MKEIEVELKVLKNEIKQALLDIREQLLTQHQNPFYMVDRPAEGRPSEVRQIQPAAGGEEPREPPKAIAREQKERTPATGQAETVLSREQEERTPAEDFPSLDKRESRRNNSPIDLTTIAGLAQWASNSIRRVGKERVVAIVEVYQKSGLISPSIAEILLKLINLAEEEKLEKKVTMKDCIAVFVQLDSVLGRGYKPESAVLSILLDEDGGVPSIKR